jgi:hypothetical protein
MRPIGAANYDLSRLRAGGGITSRAVKAKGHVLLCPLLQEGFATTAVPFPLLRGKSVSISLMIGKAPRGTTCPKPPIQVQCIRLGPTLDSVAALLHTNPDPLDRA